MSDPFGDDWLPGLRSGGVVFQVLPIFTEEQFVGEAALRRTLEIIGLAREIAAGHSDDVAIVECGDDIDRIIESGRIALLIALEGAEPIGSSLSLLDTAWRLGVRMASLTWNRRTMMADGVGERDTGGRLTSLGVEAVKEMSRLGMVLDISHLSAPGVEHVSQIASRPFVATHSSCRALCDHPRNLTDEQMRAVAASGGFVAMNAFGAFVSTADPTLEDFIDHIEHAASQVGENRVAIGADFVEDLFRMVDPVLGRQLLVSPEDLSVIPDFKAPAHYANLSKRLVKRLGLEQATRIASGNMLDFFRANLP